MKLVLQRVSSAKVSVKSEIIGSINKGLLIFLGIEKNDTYDDVKSLASKIANLRVFKGMGDKLDLSLKDIDGEILLISNFTLCSDKKHGRRPSFFSAEEPNKAKHLYNRFIEYLRFDENIRNVQTGEFGEEMQVSIVNDGPITMILESQIGKEGAKSI